MRYLVLTLAAAALLGAAPQEKEEGFEPIFNGKDMTGWTYYLNRTGPNKEGTMKMGDVWSVADGVITCKGQPPGYIRTEADYKNLVLRLQWRFEKAGNSGVLIRMTGADKVWPRSYEAQLQSGAAGDFWLIDNVPLNTPEDRINPKVKRNRIRAKTNEKPIGEWNEYEITASKDKITLKVNGEVLNEGTGGDEVAGKICLQSEGAVIQFRNIRIKKLD